MGFGDFAYLEEWPKHSESYLLKAVPQELEGTNLFHMTVNIAGIPISN